MSAAIINQSFKVIDNSIDAISTLNGSISIDTQPSGSIDIKQGGETVINITEDGVITMTAKDNQNINLTTSGTGKTVINNLEYTDKDNIYTEEVVIEHAVGNKDITVVTPDSGAYQLLIDGVYDDSDPSSDCSACYFMVKKKTSTNGTVNKLCDTLGDNGEYLNVTWNDNTINVSLVGSLDTYTKTSSTFKVKLMGC